MYKLSEWHNLHILQVNSEIYSEDQDPKFRRLPQLWCKSHQNLFGLVFSLFPQDSFCFCFFCLEQCGLFQQQLPVGILTKPPLKDNCMKYTMLIVKQGLSFIFGINVFVHVKLLIKGNKPFKTAQLPNNFDLELLHKLWTRQG